MRTATCPYCGGLYFLKEKTPRLPSRGSIYQRRDGRWVYARLINGKRISRYFSQQREAEKAKELAK